MAYLLIKMSMSGTNTEVLTTSQTSVGKLAAFGVWCSNNNVGITNWAWRDVKDVNGLYAASQMADETNYNLFQVYSLPDWENDPAQNHWVNDIAMLRWIHVPQASIVETAALHNMYHVEEERKSTSNEDDW